jgi:hypothetical protein
VEHHRLTGFEQKPGQVAVDKRSWGGHLFNMLNESIPTDTRVFTSSARPSPPDVEPHWIFSSMPLPSKQGFRSASSPCEQILKLRVRGLPRRVSTTKNDGASAT